VRSLDEKVAEDKRIVPLDAPITIPAAELGGAQKLISISSLYFYKITPAQDDVIIDDHLFIVHEVMLFARRMDAGAAFFTKIVCNRWVNAVD
jgi:hypothetical protein